MSPAATAAARAADDATLTRARAKRLLVYGALVSMPAAVALGRAPIGCGRGVLRGCGVAPHVPVLAALALGGQRRAAQRFALCGRRRWRRRELAAGAVRGCRRRAAAVAAAAAAAATASPR